MTESTEYEDNTTEEFEYSNDSEEEDKDEYDSDNFEEEEKVDLSSDFKDEDSDDSFYSNCDHPIDVSFQNLPKWVKDLMPKDLLDALDGKLHKAKCPGRQSSIDKDNVNDLAYHIKRKYKKFDQVRFFLKRQKEMMPISYAEINKKHKCHVFLAIKSKIAISSPFNIMSPAPKWYLYCYLAQSAPVTVATDVLYKIAMESPKPYDCLKLLVSHFKEIDYRKKLLQRQNIDKKKDADFYLNLPENDKDGLLKLIFQKSVIFDVFEVVEKEGNFTRIAYFLGPINMCEYVIQKKKFKEFQRFVDDHRKTFTHMHHFNIIVPRYRPLYKYAFSHTRFSGKNYKGFLKYLNNLFQNNYLEEIAYLNSKGLPWNRKSAKMALKTFNPQLISMIDPSDRQSGLDDLFERNDKDFQYFVKLGYYPSASAIAQVYKEPVLRKECINFKVVSWLPPNIKLDVMKQALANFHPEMIPEFISKFSHRFKNNNIDSWCLEKAEYPSLFYEACENLGVSPEKHIENVFYYAIDCWMNYESGKRKRDIVLMCLEYTNIIDLGTNKYLRFAIEEDDVKLALALIHCGSDTDIPNIEKKCSKKMYNAIYKYI